MWGRSLGLCVAFAAALSCGAGAGADVARADDARPLAGQTITVLLTDAGLPPAMAEEFERQTGIHLNVQSPPWDEIRTKIVAAMIAGTSPGDVTVVDWSWVGQFGGAGWYRPLDGLIDQATLDDIPTHTIFRYDGQLIGLPDNNDFRVLFYNDEHLKRAGIDKPPATLDELAETARILKQKGITQYPIGIPMSTYETTSTTWYLLTKAFGGELFDKDGKPLFTAPDSAGYKALAFEMQLLKDGLISPAAPGLRDVQVHEQFTGGQISIEFSGEPGALPMHNNPKLSKIAGHAKAALVPAADGRSRTFVLSEAYGIPKTSEHPDAALAFIKWITAPEQQIRIYEQAGNMPTRTSVLKQLNAEGKLESGDVMIAVIPSIEPLFKNGTPAWYPQFSSAVNTAINQLAKDQTSLQDAVDHIAREVEDAIAQDGDGGPT